MPYKSLTRSRLLIKKPINSKSDKKQRLSLNKYINQQRGGEKNLQKQSKTIGTGMIKYKGKIDKIPKSVYIPAGFKLDNSIIPGAGLGIFATKDFPKGYDMGSFKGRWLTPEEYNKTNKELLYVWELNDYRGNKNRPKGQKYDSTKSIGYVDGGPKKDGNYLRYVNHPRNSKEENVVARQTGGEIHYYITRPVKAGEELMVNYGPSYSKALLGK